MSKSSDRSRRTQVDRLFENFLRELDAFSHNGVLRKMEFPRIWELMDHYVDQCKREDEGEELESRIRLFIDSRVKYSLEESDLVISLTVEDSVRERIRKVLNEKLNQASKLSAIAIHWAVLKPVRFFRSTVEPILVQSVMTYSLTVQPAFVQSLGGVEETSSRAVARVAAEPVVAKPIRVPDPTGYHDENVETIMDQTYHGREAIVPKIERQSAEVGELIDAGIKTYRNVTVEVEKRILHTEIVTISRASAVIEKEALKPAGYALRDVGDIQRYMSEQSYRIMNYAKGRLDKDGTSLRVPVRFTIAPSGTIKSIDFLTTVPSSTASRIRTQMLQLRFPEIDPRFGDQVVYHSFFL